MNFVSIFVLYFSLLFSSLVPAQYYLIGFLILLSTLSVWYIFSFYFFNTIKLNIVQKLYDLSRLMPLKIIMNDFFLRWKTIPFIIECQLCLFIDCLHFRFGRICFSSMTNSLRTWKEIIKNCEIFTSIKEKHFLFCRVCLSLLEL